MSVTAASGFRAAGVAAGLKSTGAADVALVVNDGPSAVAAAVFTSNRCKANPVLWSEQVLVQGSAKAVILNSGGANCYTGPAGFQTTHATAEAVAELLGVGGGEVVVCSTGLIGTELFREKVIAGAAQAAAELAPDGGDAAAHAIMTTDTVDKQSTVAGGGWTVGGMAKGAGMLAPALATMLVVITTDADVDAVTADAALRAATRSTFDRLDGDGCMSTNDTVLLMVSGASGVKPTAADFTDALTAVCRDLAVQLQADVEGSEHDITITVTGAATEDDAVEVARSIARSNLFKCAVYGEDPNWGRVLASVGTTKAAFDPARLDVSMNGIAVCRDSVPHESRDLVRFEGRAVSVEVELHSGAEQATVWTCDLTPGYVHENSAYAS